MKRTYFIINRDEIDAKKQSLSLISTKSGGWEQHFEDESTKEKWIEYRIEPEYHGGGYPMLVRQPEPNTSELIQIALESKDLDEIAGASVFLYTNEEYGKIEFREELISALEEFCERKKEEGLSDFQMERIKTIIGDSRLYDSTNRRNITGKHFSEINIDFEYFRGIADRANRILNEIKNGAATNKRP